MKIIVSFVLNLVLVVSLQAKWISAGDKLEASDGQSYTERFGSSVDIGSKYVIVGAPEDLMSGSVYIYKRQVNGDWIETQILKDPLVEELGYNSVYVDSFGASVAIAESGQNNENPSLLIVGAPLTTVEYDEGTAYKGAFCIYELNTNTDEWQQQGECILSDNNLSKLGFSVDISNWTSSEIVNDETVFTSHANIVVGDPMFDQKYYDDGIAQLYTYQKDLHNWNKTKTISGSGDIGTSESYFGYSVAIYEDSVIVGSPGAHMRNSENEMTPDMGRVFFFNDGVSFSAYSPPHIEEIGGHNFGVSVDIFGDYSVAGEAHNEGNVSKGAVYVLKKYASSWGYSSFIQSNLVGTDFIGYGQRVAISQTHLAVGGPFFNIDMGTVFVYEKGEANQWILDKYQEGFKDWNYGSSVAFYNDDLIVGASGQDRVEQYKYINEDNIANPALIMYLLN